MAQPTVDMCYENNFPFHSLSNNEFETLIFSDSDFNGIIVCSYRRTVHLIIYEYLHEMNS